MISVCSALAACFQRRKNSANVVVKAIQIGQIKFPHVVAFDGAQARVFIVVRAVGTSGMFTISQLGIWIVIGDCRDAMFAPDTFAGLRESNGAPNCTRASERTAALVWF